MKTFEIKNHGAHMVSATIEALIEVKNQPNHQVAYNEIQDYYNLNFTVKELTINGEKVAGRYNYLNNSIVTQFGRFIMPNMIQEWIMEKVANDVSAEKTYAYNQQSIDFQHDL